MLFPLYDKNPHRRFPWLTLLIIVANVAVMAWLSSKGPREASRIDVRYGFVPLRVTQMGSGKEITVQIPPPHDGWGQPIPGGRPQDVKLADNEVEVFLTFFTTMFLHGGWLHLATNMWMLWIFGNNIEDRLGSLMFLCYYLLGGLVGSVSHWAIDPLSSIPVIGASGAVATVLGGYAITYPKAMVRTLLFIGIPLLLDLPALLVLGLWFGMQMIAGLNLLGVLDAPVAFWAHIGGFVAGVFLLPVLALGRSPPESDWRKETDELFRFEDPRLSYDDPRSPADRSTNP